MKISLPLKLGTFVIVLFAVVIAACLLWTPIRIRWFHSKINSSDRKKQLEGYSGLLSIGQSGKIALESELQKEPIRHLQLGLQYYLKDAGQFNEPIDEKNNMEQMDNAVIEIQKRKLYQGIETLMDVFLFYDATDNFVSEKAHKTLVEFGQEVVPSIENRIEKYRKNESDCYSWIKMLFMLKLKIMVFQEKKGKSVTPRSHGGKTGAELRKDAEK